MRPDTTDKRLLASSRAERSVGRFSRLRTPLGLVMRRLSADRDRGTGCIPNATLYSAAMSDRTGMCSPLTTMGPSLLSPCLSFSLSVSPWSFLCFARCFASASSILLERVISEPRGWLSNEIYGERTFRKWDRESGTCSVGEPHAARDASRIYGDDRDDTRR